MFNNAKVVVTFANPYEIKEESTGRVTSGVTVEYYFWGEHGETFDGKMRVDGKPAGVRRSKASIDASLVDKVAFVPGVYDAEFEMSVGSDGKPVLKLQDINFFAKLQVGLELMPDENAPEKGKK